ncbi:hypothetical protein ACKGJN_01445 [Gillisia sp. Q332]|uniref:hypothetical protein n=1 Tax=Gillisia xinjiangensis TaxID=3384765 RepID=UPI003919FA0D
MKLSNVRRYFPGIQTLSDEKLAVEILAMDILNEQFPCFCHLNEEFLYFIFLNELLGEEESLPSFYQNIPGQDILILTIF